MSGKPLSYGPLSEEEFIALYAQTPNDELATVTGIARKTLIMRAHTLGVRKDPAVAAATRSRANKASPKVRRGASHPCWAGGYNDRRHRTTQGREWRDAVVARDDWTCQDCHVRFGKRSRGKVQAHHIKDWVSHPDLRYDTANGISLCQSCHRRRHGYKVRGPEMKPCDCGCGKEMVAYDSQGRLRRYLKNHSPKHRAAFSRRSAGRVFSAESRGRMSAAHLGTGSPARQKPDLSS